MKPTPPYPEMSLPPRPQRHREYLNSMGALLVTRTYRPKPPADATTDAPAATPAPADPSDPTEPVRPKPGA